MSGITEFYDVIKEMIKLDYYRSTKYVLFKCDWFGANNRKNEIKVDEYGFTLVNTIDLCPQTNRMYLLQKSERCFM